MDVEINKIISQLNKLKKTARIRCIKPIFIKNKRTRKTRTIKVKSKKSPNWSTFSSPVSNTSEKTNSSKLYNSLKSNTSNTSKNNTGSTEPFLTNFKNNYKAVPVNSTTASPESNVVPMPTASPESNVVPMPTASPESNVPMPTAPETTLDDSSEEES
jgi:hypothetical protein